VPLLPELPEIFRLKVSRIIVMISHTFDCHPKVAGLYSVGK
jgi:hypothetical protein